MAARAGELGEPLIDLVLERAGITACFAVTVSSEEVARGKPAPDVYLEAASRLGVPSGAAVVIEDSTNGILAGKAAGMAVIAIPEPANPPDEHAREAADLELDSIADLGADVIRRAIGGG